MSIADLRLSEAVARVSRLYATAGHDPADVREPGPAPPGTRRRPSRRPPRWPPSSAASSSSPDLTHLTLTSRHVKIAASSAWPGRTLRHNCESRDICKLLTAKTIRNIHSILSGAFATARRWEWIGRNPAESGQTADRLAAATARHGTRRRRQVIAESRKADLEMALYLRLVAITGARRGESYALQVGDIDLDSGILHIAFNYVV